VDVARLEGISGIDVERALDYLMGETELIAYMLYQLSDGDLKSAPAEVTRLLATQDMDAAERAAHSLKSVAGMVGALGLEDLAALVESSIRDGGAVEAIEPLCAAMTAAHASLAAEVRIALDGHVPPTPV
jgi:two-component system, sensor histidine kinase and response regulator